MSMAVQASDLFCVLSAISGHWHRSSIPVIGSHLLRFREIYTQ